MSKKKNKVTFEQWAKKILSSKENSIDFLVKLGTHDKEGNLTENYK